MAQVSPQLPLDADGVCMLCKVNPSEEAILLCATCATPWHVACVSEIKNSTLGFECPDCSGDGIGAVPAPVDSEKKDLFAKIREIEADNSLSEKEKARKRQQLMSGDKGESSGIKDDAFDILGMLGKIFKCSYCMELPQRPVTTPCGHNFCLKCFEKWIKQGRRTCVKCRSNIPNRMAIQPHINSTLVAAIRTAKLSRTITSEETQIVYTYVHDQDRPDKAFTTERAQRPGMANAASGRIFVTLPSDHFGPIPAESDPRRQGVLVGESWPDRQEARQWGVHYPPIGGISGKQHYGSQSIVISGGYEDDEDHGDWFIYTGSGGRNLENNKRTNKEQSKDQDFKSYNQALRFSCAKGYPVRVLRSNKDKRSPYAPEEGYRYDGVYRIEKCWRKTGIQNFIVCRYLFVRCDNEPAPWTSDEHGDRPRKVPVVAELEEGAMDVYAREGSPSWDYDEEKCRWIWKKPPPPSKEKKVKLVDPEQRDFTIKVIRKAQTVLMREKLLKGFHCLICKQVMHLPLTTPCAHNFCKPCLENAFAGQSFSQERVCQNGRRLRSKKNVLQCPSCPTDISEFLKSPQVNREIMDVIENLQSGIDMYANENDAASDEIEKLQSGIDMYANANDAASDENISWKGKEVAVDLSNEEGENENDDENNSWKGKEVAVDLSSQHKNPLKRKASSPSTSAEGENGGVSKKSKVDDAGEADADASVDKAEEWSFN